MIYIILDLPKLFKVNQTSFIIILVNVQMDLIELKTILMYILIINSNGIEKNTSSNIIVIIQEIQKAWVKIG